MQRTLRSLFVLSLLLLSTVAGAAEVASHAVIVPSVGRVAGAFGSQWRTDLVITNLARQQAAPLNVTAVFYPADGSTTRTLQLAMDSRQTMVLRDVVRQSFGLESATGTVRVSASSPTALLSARARIYNSGSAAGEFAQTVPGISEASLSSDSYLTGLSGVDQNRTNVGIANPFPADTLVSISIYDTTGDFRGSFNTTVAANRTLQLNDVFSHFQTGPLDGATVRITSPRAVYAYASIVRSDSGDADFVQAVGVTAADGEVVTPACASPAPLHFATTPAEGWIVMFQTGVNAATTTAALEAKHGFTARFVYQAVGGFFAELTPAQIARLRCEPTVALVEQNAQASIN